MSSFVSAYGQKRSGDAAKKAADFNAALELRRGRERAKAVRRKGKRIKGTQRSLIGKSGVQMQGSPLEVMAETAALVELDAINIMRDSQATAHLEKKRGKALKKTSRLQAGASVLSGIEKGVRFGVSGGFG